MVLLLENWVKNLTPKEQFFHLPELTGKAWPALVGIHSYATWPQADSHWLWKSFFSSTHLASLNTSFHSLQDTTGWVTSHVNSSGDLVVVKGCFPLTWMISPSSFHNESGLNLHLWMTGLKKSVNSLELINRTKLGHKPGIIPSNVNGPVKLHISSENEGFMWSTSQRALWKTAHHSLGIKFTCRERGDSTRWS